MKETKRIHEGYKEWEISGKDFPQIFGKWQYLYSSDKGEISLVEFKRLYEEAPWEIYSLQGELFDDVERFETKEDAEIRIKELLK